MAEQDPATSTSDVSRTSVSDGNVEVALLESGSRFGRYAIVRLIGAGGMGAVYEATHTTLKKRVALKIIHPTYAKQPEIQMRFLREGESASRIRHQHVVDVTDFGVQEGTPFLVMEYLEGESLEDRIKRAPPLALDELVDMMLPVCSAVATAHSEGVIHRDLKPANVFLARTRLGDLQPKVVDFGVSKLIDEGERHDLTASSSMVGSPSYMAPEQIRTTKLTSPQSDQYSLGVMLYESVVGHKPFEGENLFQLMTCIVNSEFKRPRELRPELPIAFEEVILRAMARDPQQRYASVLEFGAALLPFATEAGRARWTPILTGAAQGLVPPSASPSGVGTRPVGVAGTPIPAGVNTPAPMNPGAPVPTASTSTGNSTMAQTGVERAATEPPQRSSKTPLIAVGLIAVAALVGVGIKLRGGNAAEASSTRTNAASSSPANTTQTPTPAPAPAATNTATPAPAPAPAANTFTASVVVQPTTAALELDGVSVGTGRFERALPRDGVQHTLRITAPGYEPRVLTFRDEPPAPAVELRTATAAAAEPTPPATNTAAANNGSSGSSRRPEGRTPRGGREPATSGTSQTTTTPPATQTSSHGTSNTSVGANGAAIVE